MSRYFEKLNIDVGLALDQETSSEAFLKKTSLKLLGGIKSNEIFI